MLGYPEGQQIAVNPGWGLIRQLCAEAGDASKLSM